MAFSRARGETEASYSQPMTTKTLEYIRWASPRNAASTTLIHRLVTHREMQESIDAINNRLDKLEDRIGGIAEGLNRLLHLFGQPKIGADAAIVPVVSHASTADTWTEIPALDEGTQPAQTHPDVTVNPSLQEDEVIDPDAPFSYRALNAAVSEIRVLALQPSKDLSAPIDADLFTQSLDEDAYAPGSTWKSYAALSYTWGEPTFSGSIMLNGKPVAVTPSLEAALRAMRARSNDPALMQTTAWPHDGSTSSYWWIDQICINQEDVDERNGQVALMRRIYKRAAYVQVWLGEEGDDSDTAMNLMLAIGTAPMRRPGEKAIAYPSFGIEEVKKHWSGLQALFRRPWWERVWIRQEVALSSQVSFICGSKSIPMDAIGPVLAAMRYAQELGWVAPSSSSDDPGAIQLPISHHPSSLLALHRATSGGYSYVDFASLLPASKFCKASDARDTVFSTLGLIDSDVYPLVANYHQDVRDVFMTATRVIIQQEHGLDILGICQNIEKKGNFPSWVSDLSEPLKYMPFSSCKEGKIDESHNSRLIVTDSETPDAQLEGECLTVRGGHIDSIALICEVAVPLSDRISGCT